jgi:hypothetical protein
MKIYNSAIPGPLLGLVSIVDRSGWRMIQSAIANLHSAIALEAQANPTEAANARRLADHLLGHVDVDERQQPCIRAVGEKLLDPGGALAAKDSVGEVPAQL